MRRRRRPRRRRRRRKQVKKKILQYQRYDGFNFVILIFPVF